jgi:hypothetical protein
MSYYIKKKKKLLKDFLQSAKDIEPFLSERYGVDISQTIITEATQEFEKLIPQIPYINTPRGRALIGFLLITAMELAAFKAMSKNEKSADETWEVCHYTLRAGTATIPRWRKWIMKKLLFSRIIMKLFSKRGRKQIGDFEVEYLSGEEKGFNIGVNYHRCGNIEFSYRHGGEVFAPYICMSDIALSNALGWGLTRTKTLADGCSHCDFRFINGAPTRISSKTPEVQEVIERIMGEEGGLFTIN